jgi:hypothetical protein
VEQRLELLQRLCGLDWQAVLKRFLHARDCITISEATLEQKVAELQEMLAGSAWTAGQLVAAMPTLLGARPAGRRTCQQAAMCLRASIWPSLSIWLWALLGYSLLQSDYWIGDCHT